MLLLSIDDRQEIEKLDIIGWDSQACYGYNYIKVLKKVTT